MLLSIDTDCELAKMDKVQVIEIVSNKKKECILICRIN